jgi:hypothetical protein
VAMAARCDEVQHASKAETLSCTASDALEKARTGPLKNEEAADRNVCPTRYRYPLPVAITVTVTRYPLPVMREAFWPPVSR